jgi:hypothetical protein
VNTRVLCVAAIAAFAFPATASAAPTKTTTTTFTAERAGEGLLTVRALPGSSFLTWRGDAVLTPHQPDAVLRQR